MSFQDGTFQDIVHLAEVDSEVIDSFCGKAAAATCP